MQSVHLHRQSLLSETWSSRQEARGNLARGKLSTSCISGCTISQLQNVCSLSFFFFIFLFLISLPFLLDRLIDYLFLSFYLALLRIQFSPQLESQSGFPSCRLATRVVDVVIFLQSINQTIALSSVTGHNILSNLSRHGCICVDNASRPT